MLLKPPYKFWWGILFQIESEIDIYYKCIRKLFPALTNKSDFFLTNWYRFSLQNLKFSGCSSMRQLVPYSLEIWMLVGIMMSGI